MTLSDPRKVCGGRFERIWSISGRPQAGQIPVAKNLPMISLYWLDKSECKDGMISSFWEEFSEMLKSEKVTNNIVFEIPESPVA